MEIFCWIKPKSKSDIWAQSIKKAMLDVRLMSKKRIDQKKFWSKKNICKKKYWPIYWPPHPKCHTYRATPPYIWVLGKIETKIFFSTLQTKFPSLSSRVGELSGRATLFWSEGPWFKSRWRENLFSISKERQIFYMHKSEYLIKFAFPFSSKTISSQLWGKWSCGENGAVGKILTLQYKRQCWKWNLVWPNLPLLLNNVR